MNRPPPSLQLERCLDGTFMGRCTEPAGVSPEATWVFVGSTPAEIVRQWEDRYADRSHTLALTDEERGILRRLLEVEIKIADHVEAVSRYGPVLRSILAHLDAS